MRVSLRTQLSLMTIPLAIVIAMLLAGLVARSRQLDGRIAKLHQTTQRVLALEHLAASVNAEMKVYWIAVLHDDMSEFDGTSSARLASEDALTAVKALYAQPTGRPASETADVASILESIEQDYRSASTLGADAVAHLAAGRRDLAVRILVEDLESVSEGQLMGMVNSLGRREEAMAREHVARLEGATDSFVLLTHFENRSRVASLATHISESVSVSRVTGLLHREAKEYGDVVLSGGGGVDLEQIQTLRVEIDDALVSLRVTSELKEAEEGAAEVPVKALVEERDRLRRAGDQILELISQGGDGRDRRGRMKSLALLAGDIDFQRAEALMNAEAANVTASFARVHAAVDRMILIVWLFSLVTLAIAFMTPWIISRRFVSPIVMLREVARSAGDGNLSARANVHANNEIGDLASDVNRLVERRARAEGELQCLNADLEARVEERTALAEQRADQLGRAYAELRVALESAKAAARAKGEFLANMSHEIRTPMNGIVGMTSLALDAAVDPVQKEYLGMVKKSADSLIRVIDDILDFSKIEAGRLDVESLDFHLRDCIGLAISSVALRAHEKDLELIFRVDPAIPDVLVGDAGRLRQVLVNLVGNAIKFTEHGEVAIDVTGGRCAEGDFQLRISVRDEGIGIPPEKQALIFEALSQADSSTTRQYGGTGLGLAISSELTRLMGGTIGVESEVGNGSTFTFTARFGVSANQSSDLEVGDVSSLKGEPVLIVDDNGTNRRILEEMLAQWGLKTVSVDSGLAALVHVKRAARLGRPFRLVLLDLMMPEMDGFDVAEEMRHMPEAAEVPIMMLSSRDLRGDVERCAELGITIYLLKPIQQSDLLRAILRAMPEQAVKATPVVVPSLVTSNRALNVLVAEDNEVNQRVAQVLLERRGHRVTLAPTGRAAVDACEREAFDIVLMDVQMPIMDGLEATRRLREGESATGLRLPIVAMTAHAMKGDRERCLAAGMDGYISKPLEPAAFDEMIAQFAAPGPSGEAVSEPSRSELETLPVWLSEDPEMLRELADLMVLNVPVQLAEIRDTFESGDGEALARAAHKLKGELGIFGAETCVRASRRLEELAASGDFTTARRVFEDLEIGLDQLLDVLAEQQAAVA